jgi:hypothetical protein
MLSPRRTLVRARVSESGTVVMADSAIAGANILR